VTPREQAQAVVLLRQWVSMYGVTVEALAARLGDANDPQLRLLRETARFLTELDGAAADDAEVR
jgi:hypothetical protein